MHMHMHIQIYLHIQIHILIHYIHIHIQTYTYKCIYVCHRIRRWLQSTASSCHMCNATEEQRRQCHRVIIKYQSNNKVSQIICVCTYRYKYIYIYICIHIFVYLYTHVYMYIFVCICIYIYMYVYESTHALTWMSSPRQSSTICMKVSL